MLGDRERRQLTRRRPRGSGRVAPPCPVQPPGGVMPPRSPWHCWDTALPAAADLLLLKNIPHDEHYRFRPFVLGPVRGLLPL
jgi:hypothetical protein